MRLRFELAAVIVLSGMIVPSVDAHEFWIDGNVHGADGESVLELDLKVGQMLDGVSLPFVPDTVETFDWIWGGAGPVKGAIGDVPAAVVPFDPQRGAVIFHRTKPRRLVHKDWDEFLSYLKMEGLEHAEDEHLARGLPLTGFSESYSRHAKLVVLPKDSPAIEDHYQGSPVEIVLDQVILDREHTRIIGRIFQDVTVRPSQVTVFQSKPDGLEVRKVEISKDGRFDVAVPESGSVLLNAVALSSASPVDAEWHSDWASVLIKFDQS
ncbi:MAG: hypothetical protein HKO95_15855 [Rhodobacteraceae bacterium]|nr:hypothetical protein [Paracoccaceae bacterium]